MDNFKRLSMQELYDVEGGIFVNVKPCASH